MANGITYRMCPGDRGYTRLTLRTWANVSPELRERLLKRQLDVYFEAAADLAMAVRQAAEDERAGCRVERARLMRRWLAKRRARDGAMYRINREFALSGDPRCRYCSAAAATQVDHVVPRNQGGSHRRGNLVPVCAPCNREKSGRTVRQWQEWCDQSGLSWPPDHVRPRAGLKFVSQKGHSQNL